MAPDGGGWMDEIATLALLLDRAIDGRDLRPNAEASAAEAASGQGLAHALATALATLRVRGAPVRATLLRVRCPRGWLNAACERAFELRLGEAT